MRPQSWRRAIIEGARQVVHNYKPRIKIDSSWPVKSISEICEKVTDGSHYSPNTCLSGYPYITVKDMFDGEIDFENCKFIDEDNYKLLLKNGCKPLKGDVLFSKDGTVGKVCVIDYEKDFVVLSSIAILGPKKELIYSKYLGYMLQDNSILNQAINFKTGSALNRIILENIKKIQIPLPPQSIQVEIVNELEENQNFVNINKILIQKYEKGIKDKIDEVWSKKSN